jgi:predicted DNA-binding transcriptional regulator AlpA
MTPPFSQTTCACRKSGIYDRLISLREAGHITGTSRSRQYELIKEGKYPQPVKVGKLTKFSFLECLQYVADRRQGHPPA